jgi:hypothetical protein
MWMASALVVALAFNALAQNEPRYADLPNFHQVNSRLRAGNTLLSKSSCMIVTIPSLLLNLISFLRPLIGPGAY